MKSQSHLQTHYVNQTMRKFHLTIQHILSISTRRQAKMIIPKAILI